LERIGFVGLIALIIAVSLLAHGLLAAFAARHAGAPWAAGLAWFTGR
jgi:hypothetical protein